MSQSFQKTGRHPALEGRDQHVLPTLPVRDPNRPHVFFSFASGKTELGETGKNIKACIFVSTIVSVSAVTPQSSHLLVTE